MTPAPLDLVGDVAPRVGRLRLPGVAPAGNGGIRELERDLERHTAAEALDLTYADTKRWPAPEWALECFASAARGAGPSYTAYRGDRQVRHVVAANVARFLGRSVDPDAELILTPGTQGALFAVLATLIKPGDLVALPDPEYLASERTIRYCGGTVAPIPLLWEGQAAATLDFAALESAAERGCRLVLLSHPNNPTGAVLTPDTVERIAKLAADHNMTVVVDELYARLLYGDIADFVHLGALAGMRERSVTLLGPSKTESMSGYRVGVAVGPSWLIDGVEDIQSVAALRAPAYAQHTLVPWLGDDHEFLDARVDGYRKIRDWTVERLSHTDILDVTPSAGTSYLFPRVVGVGADDHTVAKALLRDANIVVNPGYQFGARGKGHFRICIAQDEAVWSDAVDRMITVLESMRAS